MAKTLGLDMGTPPERPAKKESVKQSSNTSKREAGEKVDLNFKVSPEFKREFRLWAASHDITQKETLERAFELLKKHGI